MNVQIRDGKEIKQKDNRQKQYLMIASEDHHFEFRSDDIQLDSFLVFPLNEHLKWSLLLKLYLVARHTSRFQELL